MKTRTRILLISAVVLIGALAGLFFLRQPEPSVEEPAEIAQSVRIAYLRIGSDLPYFVGMEKGIFKKHGLEVEGIRMGDSNQASQALLEGGVDATDIIGSSVVFRDAYLYPGRFKIFMMSAAGESNNIHQLIARKGSNTREVRDLIGKRLAIFKGTQMRVYAQLFLSKFLTEDEMGSVELVPLSPPQQVQAIEDAQVDAVLTLEPTGTQLVVLGLGERIADNVLFEYVSKPNPLATAFALIGTDWAQDNPATAAALISAYSEISDFIRQNPQEAKAVLATSVGVAPEIAEQASIYVYPVSSDIDPSVINSTVELMLENKALTEAPPPAENLIYAP